MHQYLVLVMTVMGIFLLPGCAPQPRVPQYWEIINKEGKVIYRPPHPRPFPPDYELGLISFEENGKTGYRNRQGQIIVPPIYDRTSCCFHEQISAEQGYKRFYFNTHGINVVPTPVTCTDHKFNMALIEKKLAVKGLKANRAAPNDDGQLIVRSGEKLGLYDVKTNKIVIQPKFEDLSYFESDLFDAKINGLWGLINKAGRFIIPPQFKDMNGGSPFCCQGEGLIGVYQNGLGGFMNAQGKFVIKPQFFDIEAFSDGAAAVKRVMPADNRNGLERFLGINEPPKQRYGYINKSGKFITPQIYFEAKPFKQGFAAVSMGIAKR